MVKTKCHENPPCLDQTFVVKEIFPQRLSRCTTDGDDDDDDDDDADDDDDDDDDEEDDDDDGNGDGDADLVIFVSSFWDHFGTTVG